MEYHGPHGPLGTDLFIARELAERVGARRRGLVVLPELAYSPCRPETARHLGTIAIPPDLAVAVLAALLRDLFTAGLVGVVVLNAHEENATVAGLAAETVNTAFPDAFVALVNWWETLSAHETHALAGFGDNGGHGHGAAVEMSVTQAIVPHLVRPDLADDVIERPGPPTGPLRLIATPVAQIPPHGYHGRPSEISRDHGERLLELAADRIVASLDALLRQLDRQ